MWYQPVGEGHVRRERERARKLRATQWWKDCLAKGECYYCHGHFPPEALTMDHVIPVARGGTSTKGNVVPACFACNQSKAAQTPAEQILDSLGLGEEDEDSLNAPYDP